MAIVNSRQGRPEPKRVAVVSCMDPRLRLEAALGVAQGQASWIRNAGGAVTDDAQFALKAAYDLFGAREFVIVGHNECAFARGESGAWDGVGIEHVRAQMQKLRLWSGLPQGVTVRGFVYSLATNRVTEVDGQAMPAAAGTAAAAAFPVSAMPGTPDVSRAASRPAAVASNAETKRVGGKLQRVRLEKLPPAPPAIQRTGPTTDDFRRKVASMTAGEPEPLDSLAAEEQRRIVEATGAAGLSMRARDIVRSVILGEVLDRPKALRDRGRASEPTRREE